MLTHVVSRPETGGLVEAALLTRLLGDPGQKIGLDSGHPRFGKTPVKFFLSLAQILTKNTDLTRNMLYFTLKTDAGGISRCRWNRALEGPPTGIDILCEPTVLATTSFFRQNLQICQLTKALTP